MNDYNGETKQNKGANDDGKKANRKREWELERKSHQEQGSEMNGQIMGITGRSGSETVRDRKDKARKGKQVTD